eukprot:sb/3472733/
MMCYRHVRLFLDFTNLYSFPRLKDVFRCHLECTNSKKMCLIWLKKWGEIIKHKGGKQIHCLCVGASFINTIVSLTQLLFRLLSALDQRHLACRTCGRSVYCCAAEIAANISHSPSLKGRAHCLAVDPISNHFFDFLTSFLRSLFRLFNVLSEKVHSRCFGC